MELGEALYSQLSGTSDLTDLVSTRIYPSVAAQCASLPYVIFFQISNMGHHAMNSDPNIQSPRWQVSTWSETYSNARAIAKEVKASLQDYTGTMGGAGGVDVQRIFFENEIDYTDVNPETKEITHHIAQDYIIWHST